MSDIRRLTNLIVKFREARDWKQFHNPKDAAISLALEAAEVLEHFQWKKPEEIQEYLKDQKEEVGDELADVLYWILLMCHDMDINLVDAFEKKLKKSEEKYPVEKARGSAKKYSEL